jgi:hypothetical protein
MTTCSVCGVALWSDAACYGPVNVPVYCVLCWLDRPETHEGMRHAHEQMVDEAARRSQARLWPPARPVGRLL